MISTVVGVTSIVVLGIAMLSAGAAMLFLYMRRTILRETSPRLDLEVRMTTLELQVAGLPSLWEAEKKTAKRASDSGKKARKDAQRKLEEVEELIESGADLREDNGERGEQPSLFPVRRNMGVAPQEGIEDRFAAIEHLLR